MVKAEILQIFLKSKFARLCLLGPKSHAVPARNLSQTHHLCDAASSDDNPDVNSSGTVCRLRCNAREAEPIPQSRRG